MVCFFRARYISVFRRVSTTIVMSAVGGVLFFILMLLPRILLPTLNMQPCIFFLQLFCNCPSFLLLSEALLTHDTYPWQAGCGCVQHSAPHVSVKPCAPGQPCWLLSEQCEIAALLNLSLPVLIGESQRAAHQYAVVAIQQVRKTRGGKSDFVLHLLSFGMLLSA